MLLAADLEIIGFVEGDVNRGVQARNTVIINGVRQPFGPGMQTEMRFRLLNRGNNRAENPQVGFLWDDDNDLTNGWIRTIDVQTFADIDARQDNGDPRARNITTNIFLPADAPNDGSTFFIHVVADPNDRVFEDDETNNAPTSIPSVSMNNSSSDLFGYSLDIRGDTLWAGANFVVDYAVRNSGNPAFGTANTGPFNVRFYLDGGNNGPDVLLGTQNFVSGIAGDTTVHRSVLLTLPGRNSNFYPQNRGNVLNGSYQVYMVIDEANQVQGENDAYRSNNSGQGFNFLQRSQNFRQRLNPLTTDFQIGDPLREQVKTTWDRDSEFIWVRPELANERIVLNKTAARPGSDIRTTFRVINNSKIESPAVNVGIYASQDGVINAEEDILLSTVRAFDGVDFATRRGPEEGTPGSVVLSDVVTLPPKGDEFWQGVGDGDYFIGVIVNQPQELNPAVYEVTEDDITNNANEGEDIDFARTAITGTGESITASNADLFGSFFSVVETNADSSDELKVNFALRNQGTDVSPATDIGLYISTDSTIDLADTRLSLVDIDPIAVGASSGLIRTTVQLNDFLAEFGGGTDGTYFIGLIVDPSDAFVEADETNNSNRGAGLDLDSLNIDVTLQADTGGDTPQDATPLGTLAARAARVSEFVGQVDPVDFYSFRMARTGDVTIRLNGLTQNADLFLTSANGQIIERKRKGGTNAEVITRRLVRGNYLIRVNNVDNSDTNYNLAANAAYVSNAPSSFVASALATPAAFDLEDDDA